MSEKNFIPIVGKSLEMNLEREKLCFDQLEKVEQTEDVTKFRVRAAKCGVVSARLYPWAVLIFWLLLANGAGGVVSNTVGEIVRAWK